jgi:REP element-mobilizing transposase RayT
MCYLHHLEKLLTAENPGANIRLSYYPHPHYVEQHGYTARVLDSFRTYATWLHGDKRGSIDRHYNQYGSPYIPPNDKWHQHNRKQLRTKPLILDAHQRHVVEDAIRETCKIRKWLLSAFNVRTNHVHAVVSAAKDPEVVIKAFKANATRRLREERLWLHDFSPWARKGSKPGL